MCTKQQHKDVLSKIAAEQKKRSSSLAEGCCPESGRSAVMAAGRSCREHVELEEAGRSQEEMRLSYALGTKMFCCSFACCPLCCLSLRSGIFFCWPIFSVLEIYSKY